MGERRGGEVREITTHRIKRTPIVCRATSSASSGSAPAGVTLARTDSRVSGVPRELSNVAASAASLFEVVICSTRFPIASAGEGCGCSCSTCCSCPCCWITITGGPVAAGAAVAGSVVCEAEAEAAAAPDAGAGVADADAEGGVGKGLLSVVMFCFLERRKGG